MPLDYVHGRKARLLRCIDGRRNSNPDRLGKEHGSDERLDKITYVSLFGLDRARALASESHAKASATLAEAHGDTDDLRRVADYIFTRHE